MDYALALFAILILGGVVAAFAWGWLVGNAVVAGATWGTLGLALFVNANWLENHGASREFGSLVEELLLYVLSAGVATYGGHSAREAPRSLGRPLPSFYSSIISIR